MCQLAERKEWNGVVAWAAVEAWKAPLLPGAYEAGVRSPVIGGQAAGAED